MSMKLGAAYNVWDAEELLEASIRSIRKDVDYIVVVYQKETSCDLVSLQSGPDIAMQISNFGREAPNPFLSEYMEGLKKKKLIEEVVFYEPRAFSVEEKIRYTARNAEAEIGGTPDQIGTQFFNEMMKREIGRQRCKAAGCTHFMSMDTDEFYLSKELAAAKMLVVANKLQATACRMRTIFKEPTVEYMPQDEMNAVPFIYQLVDGAEFKLATPVNLLVDPTRRMAGVGPWVCLPRQVIEMYHMTFVRKNVAVKLENTSNRANYGNVAPFLDRFEAWKPTDRPIHPHPHIGAGFTSVRIIPNHFSVDITQQCVVCCETENLKRCSRCLEIRYCSQRCQAWHWKSGGHKDKCKPKPAAETPKPADALK